MSDFNLDIETSNRSGCNLMLFMVRSIEGLHFE
jgi:hypothetical protein